MHIYSVFKISASTPIQRSREDHFICGIGKNVLNVGMEKSTTHFSRNTFALSRDDQQFS